jgi:hypothetical protein
VEDEAQVIRRVADHLAARAQQPQGPPTVAAPYDAEDLAVFFNFCQ